uniref:vitamin-K-epoxide reductase (warfarin-sensitive) n=1 Tax=Plectus sambesii TaxID=2011161 RepID=A0A914VQW9_9BILA
MTGQTKKAFWLHYLQNLVGVFGLVISAYGLFVELYSAQNPHCKPMCVLHEYFSCSTALNSRFGTGLGLIGPIFGDDHVLNQKNAAYGFVTYTLLLILGKFTSIRAARIYYWITIVLNIMTVYLSVVLVYLQTFEKKESPY